MNDSLSDLEEDLSEDENQEPKLNFMTVARDNKAKLVEDAFYKEFNEVIDHIADRVRRYASGLKP